MKLFVIAAALFGALGVLIGVGVVAGSIPSYDLPEFLASDYQGGRVQVGAMITSVDSVMPLAFTVHSRTDVNQTIRVESPKAPPENFRPGIEVGLRGTYDPETRTFTAYQIMTKCPTKYEASKEVTEKPEGKAITTSPRTPE